MNKLFVPQIVFLFPLIHLYQVKILALLYIYILAVPGHSLLWLILVKCKRSVSSLLQVSAVQHTFV
jgi:hypothetical protein